MIVCTKRNANIILEQLRQLKLRKTTQKYTVIKKLKPSLISRINCKKDKEKLEELTLISIQIPPERIDKHAQKIKTYGSLSNMHS